MPQFIERFTAFKDVDLDAVVDYNHKRGLIEEINRVLVFTASETHGVPVSRICLLGAVAHWPGAQQVLLSLLDFDAPDGQAVDILFILLVPEEAHQQHLDILASIARLFSQDDFCSQLRSAGNATELYTTATHRTS